MSATFDYFVILAAMRTGSNLLEAHLNALDGVSSLGEAFNPFFIGKLKSDSLMGMTLQDRDQNPLKLVEAIRDAPGQLHGFRYFEDHDPRVLEPVLDDPRCAKIMLTRNPLDSYISLEIARETQQWQLKNIKHRRGAQIEFNPADFAEYLARRQEFQVTVLNRLQKSGQMPFYIAYDDLTNLEIINGLAHWLGVPPQLEALDDALKPQNPAGALSKVTNPSEMEEAVSRLDSFNLHRTPSFEPRRGPAVGNFVAAAKTSLIYLPVPGGPEQAVRQWMADLDATTVDQLITGQNQKQTRRWFQAHPGHRKFTVLRHPLARAHAVFCRYILNTGPGAYINIRNKLRNQFKIPLPGQVREDNYDKERHAEAFSAFLTFLHQNLSAQTSIRIDRTWSSQSEALTGMAAFALPDLILREDELHLSLPDLARQMGKTQPPVPQQDVADQPFTLAEIYDNRLEALAVKAYQRDYEHFGFGPWKNLTDAE